MSRGDGIVRWWDRTALRLPWGAAWRAQAMHLAMFVVPPLLVSWGKAIAALTFPVLVITAPGPGDGVVQVGNHTAHLREPECWIALAPCAYAEAPVPGVPALRLASEEGAFAGRPTGPFVGLPRALTWRHLWFVAWLAWFLLFVADRDRLQAGAD